MIESKGQGAVSEESRIEILLFDDDSDFDYLRDFQSPNLFFRKCRSFVELAEYLHEVRTGISRKPDIFALDIFCSDYEDFSLLGVDLKVDAENCGVQIYQNIIPHFIDQSHNTPTMFFSSYPDNVKHLRAEQIASSDASLVEICNRGKFVDTLVGLVRDSGIRSSEFVQNSLPRDMSPREYFSLFCVIAEDVGLDDLEMRDFFELRSDQVSIEGLFGLTGMVSEKVDSLLEVSILLDQFVGQGRKREYLMRTVPAGYDANALSLLVRSGVNGILAVRDHLEFSVGGSVR